jgi:ParB-like chromosome segregation protein Spo0J
METLKLNINDLIPGRIPTSWNDTEECKTATAEIKANGDVLEPVLVRSLEIMYPIVDGEKSWVAAKAAGLQEITCQVVTFDEFAAMRPHLVSKDYRATSLATK